MVFNMRREKEARRRVLTELHSKMPSCRITRLKGELISQKSGRRSTFLSQPQRQPLLIDAKYPCILPPSCQYFLDIRVRSAYSPSVSIISNGFVLFVENESSEPMAPAVRRAESAPVEAHGGRSVA